MNKTIRITC